MVSETGSTIAPVSAARHEPNMASISAISSMKPISAAQPTFLSAASTKPAGRYPWVSTVMPFRFGTMSAIAASTSLVTFSVSTPGNFSMTRNRLGCPFETASPISGWWSSITLATSPSRSLPASWTGTAASCRGVEIGEMCWTAMRWLADSKKPPVPGVDASTNVSGDTHSALPVVSITCVSDTGYLPRRQPDHGDPADRGQRLDHDRRAAHIGQGMRLGHAFLHHLPRGVQVRAGLEGQVDRGQAGHRRGMNAVQPRNAVEQILLERHGNQLLYLGGGQAERLRLDLHRRRREFRVDIDGSRSQLGNPDDHQPDGERYDQAPESEARAEN